MWRLSLVLALLLAASPVYAQQPVKTDQTTHGTTDLVAADITKIAGTAVSNTTAGVVDVNIKNVANAAAPLGNGTSAAAQRVTISSDSTGQVGLATGSNTIGSVKITDGTTVPGVIAGTTALKTDMSSIAGTATGTAASGVQKVGIVGNAGAAVDGATGSAVPANAVLAGNTDGTNTRALFIDPCAYNAWTYYYVNVSANTQIAAAAGAAKNYYICQIVILPVAAAANVNLVSSATAGNACATSTTALLTGGTTAALGASLAINGGYVLPASNRAWAITQATNHAFCIFTSAAVTGVIAYAGPL